MSRSSSRARLGIPEVLMGQSNTSLALSNAHSSKRFPCDFPPKSTFVYLFVFSADDTHDRLEGSLFSSVTCELVS